MSDPLASVVIDNQSDLDTSLVLDSIRQDNQLMAQLTQWTNNTRGIGTDSYGTPRPRPGGIFQRDRYVTPESLYEQLELAGRAVEDDDVVSSVADITEALAFSRSSFYSNDKDEEDIFNQIARDLNLDARLREMWRETFTYNQAYYAVWWTTKTYKVRGRTEDGNARRKSLSLKVPEAITFLDPLSIAPVGSTVFNREQLVYIASREESEQFDKPEVRLTDPIISRLILNRYVPTAQDKRWFSEQGLSCDYLYRLNPETVFRHTGTRAQYRRIAPVKMKSVFELLDLKHQLRSMDRAHLIGGTNFIILIKKGTDNMPAQPIEVQNLQQQVRTIARLPVLVGDHRLSVEIVTPKLDTTLDASRYSTLDSRITARLFGMFLLGGRSSVGTGTDDSSGLVKVISRGIESRRHMMQRSLEQNIFNRIFELNEVLTTAPKLKFHPKSIDLGFDPALASFLVELRLSRELSRETLLSQFDIDQDDEAEMLEREADQYDKIFQTQVPFSSPNPTNNPDNTGDITPSEKRRAGRQGGGIRNGGGAAPNSGQGQDPINPRKTSD